MVMTESVVLPLAARRNAPFSKAMTMAFVFLVPGYFFIEN